MCEGEIYCLLAKKAESALRGAENVPQEHIAVMSWALSLPISVPIPLIEQCTWRLPRLVYNS